MRATAWSTPIDHPARRAPDFARADRSRRAEGALPSAAVQSRRVSRRRQRARPAARPPAEGLRHRHRRRIRYQVKRLFRNCWIIGRRFRLAHVRFGTKTIEVATFRRQLTRAGAGRSTRPRAEAAQDAEATEPGRRDRDRMLHPRQHVRHAGRGRVPPRLHGQRAVLRHRDVLDHRLHRRARGSARRASIRSIGDPDERFQEDPVRMLRAVVLAARLDFTIDPPIDRRDRRARAA